MSQKVPPKRDVMLALLQQADSVYVNFDPRREGVMVPPQLKKSARVVLQYGMNMAIPIPDLDVGEDGIGATLSFDQRPCWTFVPWSAVFAIVSRDQRGMLWEGDVPPEVELDPKKPEAGGAKRPAQAAAKNTGKRTQQQPAKRPALRAVEGGRDDAEPSAASASVSASSTPMAAVPSQAIAATPPASVTPRDAVSPTPKRAEAADQPVSEEQKTTDTTPESKGASKGDRDEIVEPPQRDPKKKRELPPYLRVVK